MTEEGITSCGRVVLTDQHIQHVVMSVLGWTRTL